MDEQAPPDALTREPANVKREEGGGKAAPHPLPDKPRLRPLEAFMIDNPNRGDSTAPKLLVLRDPSGLAPDPITLPPMGAAVVELCDGDNTHEQIRAEFQKRYRAQLSAASLEGLLRRLDEARMLESASFKAYAAEIFSGFARAEARPAMFAGRSYPADPAVLRAQMEGFFAPPNGPGLPPLGCHRDAAAPAAPRGIIAPHVDMARGGPAYAWAYRPLLQARELPDLIIVLGTNHNAMDPAFTLTRKHYQTPLGTIETDIELLGELLEGAKGLAEDLPERLLRDEYHHRGEHSIEFQMLWLRFVLSRRQAAGADPEGPQPRVLPILCGSLHEFVIGLEKAGQHDPMAAGLPRSSYAPMIGLLGECIARRQERGQRVLWLGAADLAHVGPRYGDREALSGADCDSLERRDRDTLRPVCAGDGDAWFREIRRERDGRRVCGLSPIYAMLKAARPGLADGQLRCYAQCQAEAGSVVSIASVIFPG